MKKMIEIWKENWIIYLIGVGVLLWAFFAWNAESNSYHMEISGEAMTAETGTGWCESPDLYLEPGEYAASLNYKNGNKAIVFRVVDTYTLDEHNETGEVLSEIQAGAGAENESLNYRIEEKPRHVKFQILVSNGEDIPVSSVAVHSEQPLYRDHLVWILFAIGILILFTVSCWRRNKESSTEEFRKRQVIAVTLVGVALLASIPLFTNVLFWGHDIWFHLSRIDGLTEGLRMGQFPVRLEPNATHGFGYGASVFYPELFLYPGALLRLAGISTYMVYKILLTAINLVTAFIAYVSFRHISGSRKIGLTAAVFYTLSLYRLINLYTRAAVGESLAMAFFPLIMWGTYEIVKGNYRKWWILAVGYTCIIQSHILSVLTAGIGILIFLIVNFKTFRERVRVGAMVKAAVSTFLVNLWFLLPLAVYSTYPFYAYHMEYDLKDSTVFLPQLFGLGSFHPDELNKGLDVMGNEMPFAVGYALLIGAALFIIRYFMKHEKKEHLTKLGRYSLLMAGGAMLLAVYPFPWDVIQKWPVIGALAEMYQYPWRFLSVTAVFLSLTAAIGFGQFLEPAHNSRLGLTAGCIVAVLCAGLYLNSFCEMSQFVYQKNDMPMDKFDYMYTMAETNWYGYHERGQEVLSDHEDVRISQVDADYGRIQFSYQMPESSAADTYLEVPLTYYPAYRAVYSDGKSEQELPVTWSKNSLVKISPQAPGGTITVFYDLHRWYFVVGNGISALTLVVFFAYYLYRKKQRRKVSYVS